MRDSLASAVYKQEEEMLMSNHETFLLKEAGGHIRELTGPMMAALIGASKENRQHWVGAKGDLVKRISLALNPQVVLQEPLLSLNESFFLGPVSLRDLHAYFKTKKGLWVSGQFIDRVLSQVPSAPVCINKKTPLQSHTLIEGATDVKIRQALPEDHVFEAAELCVIISSLIGEQLNGREGRLLVNGYTNLFYVKGRDDQVCVVVVYWGADYRGWYVLAWDLDDSRWNAGCRFFSRNC